MLKKALLTVLALLLIAAPGFGSVAGNLTAELEPVIVGEINQTDVVVTPVEESIWLQLRTVGQEKVFWTRMAITAVIQGGGEKDPVINRLLRTSKDISETLIPYLGKEAASKYGAIIGENLNTTMEFAAATKDGNQTAIRNANGRWYKNAEEIALFENATIPSLSLNDRKAMWYEHINLTEKETNELLNKDYNASIDTTDRIEEQANLMSDSLANGIILQFPKKFH
jgi:hypothetical protein